MTLPLLTVIRAVGQIRSTCAITLHEHGYESLRETLNDRSHQSDLVAREYPDGSVSFGYTQLHKTFDRYDPLGGIERSGFGTTYESRETAPVPLSDDAEAKLYLLMEQYEAEGNMDAFWRLVEAMDRRNPMGLSDATIWEKVQSDTHPQRERKGLIGIPSAGKRMVRSAVTILQRDQKHRAAFFTGTLPALSADQREQANKNFSAIVKLFIKKIRYHVQAAGVEDFEYCFVSEIQESRFLKTGEIYPHVHLIFTNRKLNQASSKGFGFIDPWIVTIDLSRKLWRESVENYCGKLDWKDADTRIEKPKANLNRELGKYMSKGSNAAKLVREQGTTEQLPKHWYGVSDTLRAKVKSEIKVYRGEEARAYLQRLRDLERKGLASIREVPYKYTDASGHVVEGVAGYVGFIKLGNTAFERLRMVA